MKIDNNKIAELKHFFGLNLYEAKLWIALLSKGYASASELSELSNVPRSRTYDVLESLEKRGFISVKLGKPINYIALSPEQVVERLKQEIREEREAKIKETESITEKESFKMLKTFYEKSESHPVMLSAPTAVKGRKNIYSKLSEIISKSQRSLIIASDEKGVLRKSYELSEALKQAKNNGATLKVISKMSKKSVKDLKEIFEIKEKNTAIRFVLADDNLILFTHDAESVSPEHDTCVIIKSPYIESAFKKLF